MSTKKIILTVFVVWILFGIHNWGATLGDFCGSFPNSTHRSYYGVSAGVAIAGPIGFPAAVLCSNFYEHGFVWK